MPEGQEDRDAPEIGRPTQPRAGQPRLKPRRSPTHTLIVGGTVVLLVLFAVFAPRPTPTSTEARASTPRPAVSRVNSSTVIAECRTAVRAQLVSPRSARWQGSPDPFWNALMNQWQYQVRVEAQNAFGVWIMGSWSCVRPEGGRALVYPN